MVGTLVEPRDAEQVDLTTPHDGASHCGFGQGDGAAQISDAVALRRLGLDTRLVARRVTEAYLMQVLRHGFLHSGARPWRVLSMPGMDNARL